MSVEPVGSPAFAPYLPPAPSMASPKRDFAAVLGAHLAEPRDEIAEVRAAIAAVRSGRALASAGAASTRTPDIAQRLTAWSQRGTGTADPYGWRALTRELGDGLIAPGFGSLFERQIQQESGYDPAVVFGQRHSTAGAEGIAQLMPQFYAGVDRTDPDAALRAAAGSMRHYLTAFDGDVRKALASYNAGMGRVQQLVRAHGADWERGLPAETKDYLAAVVGGSKETVRPGVAGEAAVFGGRGGGGVLSAPLDRVQSRRREGDVLALLGAGGVPVRAPADALVTSAEGTAITLDHGNGWQTTLGGLASLAIAQGDRVRRGDNLGALGGVGAGGAMLRLGVSLQGRPLDPLLYLIGE